MGTLDKERNALRVVIGDRESNGYRLFINLLTDSLPALAIGMEPADERLLDEKPRDPKAGIMTRDFVMTMIAEGTLIAVVTMTAYHIGIAVSPAIAQIIGLSFIPTVIIQLIKVCRNKKGK